ncbi:histamine H2 receptor-like [Littorina saxatilis]|uniref:histamine H2 receptor-like n=1 Tax=Littorina saxatilis TaxID=31220 RepID=UPI0038B548DE
MSCNTASSTCDTGWLNSTSPKTNESEGSGVGEEPAGVRTLIPVWKVCAFIIIFIIMAAAIAGNLLVCIAVYSNHHLRKKSYFFFVSLAVSDLLMGAFIMPFASYNDLTGRWVFGGVFCNIWVSCDVLFTTASILNLCVISLDRHQHITNPFTYGEWMTVSKCAGCILSVWLVSTLISLLPASLGLVEKEESAAASNWTEGGTIRCEYNANLTYAIVSSSVSFYIPAAVMITIYIRLFRYSRQHAEAIRRATATGFPGVRKKHAKHSYKAAQTLGVVVGAFLVCWLPLFIMIPVRAYCRTCISPVAFHVINWFGYANSCLNPIIYDAFNKEFRSTFRQILCPSTHSHGRTVSGTVGVRKRTSHQFGHLFESFQRAHLRVGRSETYTTENWPTTTLNFTSKETDIGEGNKNTRQQSSLHTLEQTDVQISQEKIATLQSSLQTLKKTDMQISQEKIATLQSSLQTLEQTDMQISQEKIATLQSSLQTLNKSDMQISQEKNVSKKKPNEQKSSLQTVEQTDRNVSQEKTIPSTAPNKRANKQKHKGKCDPPRRNESHVTFS